MRQEDQWLCVAAVEGGHSTQYHGSFCLFEAIERIEPREEMWAVESAKARCQCHVCHQTFASNDNMYTAGRKRNVYSNSGFCSISQ